VRDAAVQLHAKGEVVLGDSTLGIVHTQKGVAGPHFMVWNIRRKKKYPLKFKCLEMTCLITHQSVMKLNN